MIVIGSKIIVDVSTINRCTKIIGIFQRIESKFVVILFMGKEFWIPIDNIFTMEETHESS